jgi:hypothetical protein
VPQSFVCRSCGADTCLHIGSIVRAYQGDKGLVHEPISLYACAECTVVFFSPPNFGGKEEVEADQPQSVDEGA